MKFLCVSCDEGMKLESASGPHEGSLQATFVCSGCGAKIAMLTNPWETQLVQSMGIKVGGRTSPVLPYEQIRGNLGTSAAADSAAAGGSAAAGAGCPFADMFEPGVSSTPSAGPRWNPAAQARIERIPSFIRPMVQRAIERYASEQGYQDITEAILDEARSKLGM